MTASNEHHRFFHKIFTLQEKVSDTKKENKMFDFNIGSNFAKFWVKYKKLTNSN